MGNGLFEFAKRDDPTARIKQAWDKKANKEEYEQSQQKMTKNVGNVPNFKAEPNFLYQSPKLLRGEEKDLEGGNPPKKRFEPENYTGVAYEKRKDGTPATPGLSTTVDGLRRT